MQSCSPYVHTTPLTRAFPAPAYLTMPAVGIDISDYSIKHMYLRRGKHGAELVAHGKLDLPLGTVEQGEVKDRATLVKLLSRLRQEREYEYVHLALPEEHAYLFQMEVTRGTQAEMRQMVEFHLKENIPLGAEEALFDLSVLEEKRGNALLNISAYPLAIALEYEDVFEEAGYKLVSVEIEGQATARALLPPDSRDAVLIIDVGRNQASLSISTRGTVTFTANLETGGDFLTRAVARGLDLSFQEAERVKREHGFRDTKASGPIFEALLPTVSELKESIRKHLMYWQMHTSAGGGEAESVSRVILAGGNANIVGIPEYLEAMLEVPVEVGNVWRNIMFAHSEIPPIQAAHSLEYATSVGLALRSLMRGS